MNVKTVMRIAAKELGLVFSSPIAYLFLAAFLGATLFVFFWGETFFARTSPMCGRCSSRCRCC